MKLKDKIEALLFTLARRITIEEFQEILKESKEAITNALEELIKEYNERNSAIIIQQENNAYKMSLKPEFLPFVERFITKKELDKPLLETLAVVAWKHPNVLQSEVIKIRHNKAYEHLKQLEELGFIKRQKHGKTKKISLTDKFFEYFDIPPKELKNLIKKNEN